MTRALPLALVVLLVPALAHASREEDERLARAATALVTAALADGAPYEVVTERDLADVVELEVEKQLVGCEDTSCLTDLAGALGARHVVMGQLDHVGGQLVLNLALFDNDEARVVARAGVTATDERELAARLPPATRRLRDSIVRAGAVRVLVLDARVPIARTAAEEPAPVLLWTGIGLVIGGGAVWALTYLGTAALYLSIYPIVRANPDHVGPWALHFVPGPGPIVAALLLGPAYAQPLAFASGTVQMVALVVTAVGGGLWAADALSDDE